MAKFSLSSRTIKTILLGAAFVALFAFFYLHAGLTIMLAGIGTLVGIGYVIYEELKKRKEKNHHSQNRAIIEKQLKNPVTSLPEDELALLFKAVSECTSTVSGLEDFCKLAKRSDAEQTFSAFFAPFSPEQKMKLLMHEMRDRHRADGSILYWLLWQKYDYTTPLLKALTKGLSPEDYSILLNHCAWGTETDQVEALKKMNQLFNILIPLFKEMPVKDKLTFLEIQKQPSSEPLLLKILNAFSKVFIVASALLHPNYRKELVANEKILKAKKIEFLTVLFERIPSHSLKTLLAVKHTNDSGSLMGPLDISLESKDVAMTNFLIERGALEADPEYDITKLLKRPDNPGGPDGPEINLTPYRNALKARLDQVNFPDRMVDPLKEIICDCLLGEVPKKAKVASS